MAEKTVFNPCTLCGRETNHDVLYSHTESEFDYRVDTIFSIVKCRGCLTSSFRKEQLEIEIAYPDEEDGEWHVPKTVWNFPKVLKGYRELDDVWGLPTIVKKIYLESVSAIKEGSYILAGIGLRATIEAICNDKNILGKTLDKRIDGLIKQGFISQKDSERLHAIRFIGNDAAHEIKPTELNTLLIALRITEHLIVSLYILDDESKGALDTIIRNYADFIKLLESKLVHFNANDEFPLAKFLGKDVRRLHGYFQIHEAELISQITSGNYTKLTLGVFDKFNNSRDSLQHFKIV